MNIYYYHHETGIYLGKDVADKSPREPSKYLIPACATTLSPPKESEGFDRCFLKGTWQYIAKPKPPEPEPKSDPAPKTLKDLIVKARLQRNDLLRESDYTQLPDVQAQFTEETNKAWSDYRQALRDLTLQPDFPENIEWPTMPE